MYIFPGTENPILLLSVILLRYSIHLLMATADTLVKLKYLNHDLNQKML
jgi:hypothetical protein